MTLVRSVGPGSSAFAGHRLPTDNADSRPKRAPLSVLAVRSIGFPAIRVALARGEA